MTGQQITTRAELDALRACPGLRQAHCGGGGVMPGTLLAVGPGMAGRLATDALIARLDYLGSLGDLVITRTEVREFERIAAELDARDLAGVSA